MPRMIGLDKFTCQQGSDSSTAYGIMPFHDLWLLWPFCDIMAFGHFDTLDTLGLMPDDTIAYQLFCCIPGDTL